MAASSKPKIKEKDLDGFRQLKCILPMLSSLRTCAVERDRGKNRELFFDQYCALLLLYFFNPIVTSLRGLQQSSELKKVQRLLGCKRASLGSLSEAGCVFDPDLLLEIIGDLRTKLPRLVHDKRLAEIENVITLVDGSILKALPKLTEAMWVSDSKCAFKTHTHFELITGVPVSMKITSANHSERAVLADSLESGRLYVTDRGYAEFALFQKIINKESSFVCRVRDNSVFDVIEDRPLTDDAKEANVVSDQVVHLGCKPEENALEGPVRLIQIKCTPHKNRGGQNQGETLLVVTDRMDLDADVIALLYQSRWQVEIFFRFFKHILGCRHLLSQNTNGIEIQTYMAIIACMLISLWTGRKPTLRTVEMLRFYFSGMADEEEMQAHIERLQKQDALAKTQA